MAEDEIGQRNSNPIADEDRKGKDLKYLDFVKAAILYIVVYLARLYEYGRENSGPLKPRIQALEGSINFVIGPIYRKFHGTPFSLLQFLDHKVDEAIQRLERTVKKASNQAVNAAHRTPIAARVMASEAGNAARDMYARYEPTAKELYMKYEPVAIQYAVLAWQVTQWIPVVRQMTQVALPAVRYGLKVYNWTVWNARQRGYMGARYMPVVPLERIAKVFNEKS